MLLKNVGLSFVAKKAGAQRFIFNARASNQHFFKTSPASCSQARDFATSNFRERLVAPTVFASEVGYSGESIERKRLVPNSLIYLVPATLPMGFSWAMFFCQDVTDHCTLTTCAHYHLFVCRDHSTPPLRSSQCGLGSDGFRWSQAGNLGSLARGANCTNVHLAHLIAGVQGDGLDVHASGSAGAHGYEVYPANSYGGGTGKRLSRIRSVAQEIKIRRRSHHSLLRPFRY